VGSEPELAATLRDAILRVGRRARNAATMGGLTVSQISALTTLDSAVQLSPRELAEREQVQPPTLTRIVAKLEARGLLERDPHPTDGRQHVLRISEAGRALLERIRQERNEWLAQRVARLSAADRDVLREAAAILHRIAKDE
jgi:DNA-binding MarR family transcriptional regulator